MIYCLLTLHTASPCGKQLTNLGVSSSLSSTENFLLCAVPAFLGKVSDLVKWGFFVWMACLAHIPYNNFFPIFKYASQLCVCEEVLVFTGAAGCWCSAFWLSIPRTRWKVPVCCGRTAASMNTFPSACLFWWVHIVPPEQVWCKGCWGSKAETCQGDVEKEGGVQRTLP